MSSSRKVLSLSKNAKNDSDENSEISVPVGIFDVQLPARQFRIQHKVAEVGDVLLTTEFLLRLLYSADGMPEDAAANFFGYDDNEMAYVLKDAEARAFISRSEGRIWLTDAGLLLFKDGIKPQIYEVVKKSDMVGFDLLSLAPCDRETVSDFDMTLPELKIRNSELVANASAHVPDSFRRFYGDIIGRKERDTVDILKRSLYSVDNVVACDRFPAIVSFVAMANARRPGEPEPILDSWKIGHELEDRDQVVHGVAEYLENLRQPVKHEDSIAYEVLTMVAPEYLKDYVIKSGFSALRYFKTTAIRAGDLQRNRPTVGIIGSLYLPANMDKISTALSYSKDYSTDPNDAFVWVKPNQPTWGTSRSFLKLIEMLTRDGASTDSFGKIIERAAVVVTSNKPERHPVRSLPAFYEIPNNRAIPGSLEILLIPQRVVAITVHSPVTAGRGFPIPLGILSFDEAVVRRTHEYLLAQLPRTVKSFGKDQNEYKLHNCLNWTVESEA
jgi:hypothetical protein